MGIFGRKRRTEGDSAGRHAAPEADGTIEDGAYEDEDGPELSDVSDGPYDVADFDETFEEIESRANDAPRHADRLRSHLN